MCSSLTTALMTTRSSGAMRRTFWPLKSPRDDLLERLEQPVRVRLFGGEPGVFECVEDLAGLFRADEEVDVVGPARAADGGRPHAAHQQVVDAPGVQGGAGVAEDLQKALLVL